MNTKDYKAVAKRFYDHVLNQGDMSMIEETVASDFVDHSSASPGPGIAGLRKMVEMYRTAFPDVRFTAEEMIVEGDKLVIMYKMEGTHRGPFMDMPATGKHVEMSGVDIVRFDKEGKAAEHWEVMDEMGMMKQLGFVKMVEPAAA